jgi:hypothetical protein
MILPPAGMRVLIATRPVDFRRGRGRPGGDGANGPAAGPVLRDDLRVSVEASGPPAEACVSLTHPA